MHRLILGAITLLVLAAACGNDNIPLGIEAVGPRAPAGPGPQGPTSPGPGRLGGGASDDDVVDMAIAPETLFLLVGDSAQVVAVAVDENNQILQGVNFTWESSDPRIVRVREDPAQEGVGVVTALAPGSALVNASAGSVTVSALVVVSRRR